LGVVSLSRKAHGISLVLLQHHPELGRLRMPGRASHETDEGSELWKHLIVSEKITLKGHAMIHVLRSPMYR
jgi:hypothetical protein